MLVSSEGYTHSNFERVSKFITAIAEICAEHDLSIGECSHPPSTVTIESAGVVIGTVKRVYADRSVEQLTVE